MTEVRGFPKIVMKEVHRAVRWHEGRSENI
jgi:hypothetical protein